MPTRCRRCPRRSRLCNLASCADHFDEVGMRLTGAAGSHRLDQDQRVATECRPGSSFPRLLTCRCPATHSATYQAQVRSYFQLEGSTLYAFHVLGS